MLDRFHFIFVHWPYKGCSIIFLLLFTTYVFLIQDKNQRTPLHWAAKFGHLKVCELIIKNIEDPTGEEEDTDPDVGPTPGMALARNPKDCDGNTPLHFAVENGHNDIFDLIIDSITPWVFRALKQPKKCF